METKIMQISATKENATESLLNSFFVIFAEEFGNDICEKWLAKLEIISHTNSEIIFSAPSKFIRDWVIREFIETKKILKLLQKSQSHLKKVAVVHVAKESASPATKVEIKKNTEEKIVNLSKTDNLFAFGTELNPRFTFDNFVSAKYNKLAISMAKIAAGVDAQISMFEDKIPLFIHGGVGVGKTHLAQAIAWKIKEFNKTKKVVYLSAEKFMYHFVQSIRSNNVMSFKEKMRSIDVLIVDDVQFIAGKDRTQQEFMNSFNSLVEDNKQVVLVCDRCPSDLENIDEKLKSRIAGGMIVNFKNPDYQDRLSILKNKIKLMEQEIPENVTSFIAEKISNNIRDLDGALKKLCAAKVFLEEEITMDNARNILSTYIKSAKSSAPTVEKIQKAVAGFYGIKISDLTSASRLRSIARPRQVAMYLSKNMTSESLPVIGKAFSKNHATVIHSVKLVQEMMNSDSKFLQEIKTLEEKI